MSPDEISSLEIAVTGVASIGLVTSVTVITRWVRELLNLDGNQVRWAATIVAAYVVATFGLTTASWKVEGIDVADIASWLGVGLYLVCTLAAMASAANDRFNAPPPRNVT